MAKAMNIAKETFAVRDAVRVTQITLWIEQSNVISKALIKNKERNKS
tara:strand:+ start:26 stop:166 length:141 start_codon:yes stop_codon:yes gene_type:complete